jgi:hypothetical protein
MGAGVQAPLSGPSVLEFGWALCVETFLKLFCNEFVTLKALPARAANGSRIYRDQIQERCFSSAAHFKRRTRAS